MGSTLRANAVEAAESALVTAGVVAEISFVPSTAQICLNGTMVRLGGCPPPLFFKNHPPPGNSLKLTGFNDFRGE